MPRSETLQSDAEWIALDALVQMLEDRFGHSIVRSECVPRQDDPPDFRLTIEGIEYGIEVTIVSDGDNQQYAWFDEFITQLRIQVDQKNYQLGRVNVTLNQRPKIPNAKTRAGRDEIARAVIQIGNHFTDPEKRDEPLECKLEGQNSIVFRWIGPGFEPGTSFSRSFESSYTPGTRERVLDAIVKSAEAKRAKLTKKGFPLDRSILLLYDDFRFSESREVIIDTADCVELQVFHSVGWIPAFSRVPNRLFPNWPGRPCKLLWSVRKDWMGR